MHDVLCDGRRFRAPDLIDGASREALAMHMEVFIPSARLIRALGRPINWFGCSDSIRMGNGPDTTRQDFIDWTAIKAL